MSSTANLPKVMTALIRRPDLSREDFARYYEQTHAPLGATYIPWRKYVRNHLVNASPADPGYDCLGEFWLDSMASLGAVLAGPLGEFYARDEAQFMKLNPPGPGGWATSSTARAADVTEHLLYGSPRAVDSSAIRKYMLTLRNTGTFTHDTWCGVAAEFGRQLARQHGSCCIRVTMDEILPGPLAYRFPADAVLSLWWRHGVDESLSLGSLPKGMEIIATLLTNSCETSSEELLARFDHKSSYQYPAHWLRSR